jgi:hypothetical protein
MIDLTPPWKISFSPSGSTPYAVKIKLYDLLFDSAGQSRANTGEGTNLSHDIILFDPAAYTTSGGGTINPLGTINESSRRNHGIFLTKVAYDTRSINSVRDWHADAGYLAINKEADPHNGERGYYTYKSEAALPVLETDYTTTANKTYYDRSLASTAFVDLLNPDQPINDNPADPGYNPIMCYGSSVTTAVSGLVAATTSALILSGPDFALQSAIPGSSLQPYTRIHLQDAITNSEIVNILQFFTDYDINVPGNSAADLINPAINTRLLSVEIWVRCSFFGDYVIPTTFAQDLTPSSETSHKNIIVGQGDFKRFTREPSSSEIKPYIPLTPPRNDVLAITDIANASPFPIPPVAGEYYTIVTPTTPRRAPLGWVDPDFDGTIIPGYVSLPLLGNVYTSGRIFSPTIDELWIYIKKVVDGQITNNPIPKEPALNLPTGVGDPLSQDGLTYVSAPSSIIYTPDTVIQAIVNATLPDSYQNYFPIAQDQPVPRENPYSLREIESILDNSQYNLRTLTGWVFKNGAFTGNINTAIGTLYQLHAEYNPVAPTSKQWAVENTYNADESATNYGNALLPVSGYDYKTNFIAGDSYLSADGKWHYLFDHIRVPVLAEIY